ncbi:MAG: hypothetical protein B6I31_04965 [Desulfobacteraceae bacterium 4572_19]|nr:MAG: hypothetical protein B6I31_04965 [Desulfobacteraceae bacterium 4572_19]
MAKLSLSNSTIIKIFREHFHGEEPIIQHSLEEQIEFISDIKQKLEIMEGIKLLENPYYASYSDSHMRVDKNKCYFEVISPSKYYEDQKFYLEFNEKNELLIVDNYRIYTHVYHLKQMDTFVDKMIQEYKRLAANYLKRENKKIKQEKIKDIKYKAIQAKIHEIAKEDKFKFCMVRYGQYAELTICLGKAEEMKINIPYNKFHDVFESLHTTIQTIRDLRNSGLKFQIRSYMSRYYDEPNWIT